MDPAPEKNPLLPARNRVSVAAKGEYRKEFARVAEGRFSPGFRVDGEFYDIEESRSSDKKVKQ